MQSLNSTNEDTHLYTSYSIFNILTGTVMGDDIVKQPRWIIIRFRIKMYVNLTTLTKKKIPISFLAVYVEMVWNT